MEKIGFIGVGNMGGTLAKIAAQSAGAENILVSSRTTEKAAAFARKTGCIPMTNEELAGTASYIFLGVKPQKMAELLDSLCPVFAARKDRFVLVTMAAGLTTRQIAQMAGGNYPVLRIMPNTPSLVKAGVISYCAAPNVTEEDCKKLEELMAPAGCVLPMAENLIDAASALSGCGPAFVYIYIEALADAGVSCGLPRDVALQLAAQTVLGAGKMVLETGIHPAQLKDAVCSPGGSTIAGVCALEKSGFRTAAEDAVLAAFRRTKELGN